MDSVCFNGKIGFIGGGNMAFAIVSGLLLKKVKAEQIEVAGPRMESLKKFVGFGVSLTNSNSDTVSKCNIVFICVKPHQLETFFLDLEKNYKTNENASSKIFISVLAGVKLIKLEECLDFIKNVKVIRTMPNTSTQVGEGCIAFSRGKFITENDIKTVYSVLSLLGLAQEFPEYLIDAITGVIGCGPAFVYTIIEALADGALKEGVPKEIAIKFTAQTLLGASKTLLESGKHPSVLRDEVCSPGGSTICGIHELEKGNLRATLINAVEKSVYKSKMLGDISNK